MLRKWFVLAVAVMVMGAAVAPQIQAQDYSQMEREIGAVAQDMQSGKITPQQAQQRIAQIQQKYMGGSDATVGGGSPQFSQSGSDEAQAQNWAAREQATQTPQWIQQQMPQQTQRVDFPAGERSGWPSSSVFRRVSLPSLRQPAGTTASYTVDEYGDLSVYIKGGKQAHFDELVRTISGGNSYKGQSEVRLGLDMPAGKQGYNNYFVTITLQDGGITLNTQGSAG